jgi:hypothetical protein
MARYHVNRLGRFSSPDLVAGAIGDPQSLNRYAYVRNDSVNAVDPLGLRPSWWCSDGQCAGEDALSNAYGSGVWTPGINACGVDSACIANSGGGAFGSPLAQPDQWVANGVNPWTLPQYSPPTLSGTNFARWFGGVWTYWQHAYTSVDGDTSDDQGSWITVALPYSNFPLSIADVPGWAHSNPIFNGLAALRNAGQIASPITRGWAIGAWYLSSAAAAVLWETAPAFLSVAAESANALKFIATTWVLAHPDTVIQFFEGLTPSPGPFTQGGLAGNTVSALASWCETHCSN